MSVNASWMVNVEEVKEIKTKAIRLVTSLIGNAGLRDYG